MPLSINTPRWIVREPDSILIVQTAFPGDVILTLPLAQVLRSRFPGTRIGMVIIPKASEIAANHPSVDEIIIYDKRGRDSGVGGFIRQVRSLRKRKYDLALVPHRSLRSALLVAMAGIRRRIGFRTSAGRFLLTTTVPYVSTDHEIVRDLALAAPLGIEAPDGLRPEVYPSYHDHKRVSQFLSEHGMQHNPSIVALAPGTVWNTKRWLPERFGELTRRLVAAGYHVVLIGGAEDQELCESIDQMVPSKRVSVAAGRLTILQSAELIRRCKVLVSNDSAPVHLAGAVRAPVVAIFGPTVPSFGFGPRGTRDRVIEISGLKCRPCSIHGGDRCPIGTFVCMEQITAEQVFRAVLEIAGSPSVSPPGREPQHGTHRSAAS